MCQSKRDCTPRSALNACMSGAAHDTTAQHADAIIDFFEAAASKSQVPAREEHPVFCAALQKE